MRKVQRIRVFIDGELDKLHTGLATLLVCGKYTDEEPTTCSHSVLE